ncbi:MAG: hypoxanthine phosphoribosyltransferase [Phycisphaerae bacterium]|nr:hypoxanthine phosphoribosyltransferase [Phycisphaerae bacterium]
MPCSRIILNEDQLSETVSRLAQEISAVYHHAETCLALVVLEGARYFAHDLLKQLNPPIDTETITASSYSGVNSTGNVVIDKQDSLKTKIRGKNILLIDDIYETGLTLSRILDWLNECGAQSVKTCVLLEKQITHKKDIKIDFLGSSIEDEFIIGYGLDFDGQYRDLPFIGVLSNKEAARNNPAYKP